MPNICLTFGTSAAPDKVMEMLNTIEGLSKWWTILTSGSTEEGGIIEFRFPDTGPDMKVIESAPDRVEWECTAGPDEWIGTRIHFDVSQKDGQTHLMFKHEGWAEEVPFFYHCSTKWAVFMVSLRNHLETGKGQPFTDDIQIDLN